MVFISFTKFIKIYTPKPHFSRIPFYLEWYPKETNSMFVFLTHILIIICYVFRHCPNCSTFQNATKKLDLWKLPNTLILHLKRIVFNETGRGKIGSRVVYPMFGLSIDHLVANQYKDKFVYDLIGVCNHYETLKGGHCK